ncbi:hypothetical protein ACFLT4_01905, partial [Chloroflexota bacterium]
VVADAGAEVEAAVELEEMPAKPVAKRRAKLETVVEAGEGSVVADAGAEVEAAAELEEMPAKPVAKRRAKAVPSAEAGEVPKLETVVEAGEGSTVRKEEESA